MFIAALFIRAKKYKQLTYPSTDKSINYLYNGILFSNKKNEVVTHVTSWMNLENM